MILTNQTFNPSKHIFLNKDLSNFFNDKLSSIQDDLNNNQITNMEALNIVSEINRYNFIDCNSQDITNDITSGCYNLAVSLYNQNNFTESYYIFSCIPSYSIEFNRSLQYMDQCKQKLKEQTIFQADDLCNNNYYSKALDLFYSVNDIIGNDQDVINKISQIEDSRSNFIAMQKSDPNSSSDVNTNTSTTKINSYSINKLSLQSNTNYLIHVNIKEQKTYVYSGSINTWSLIKTMICSTGKANSETPEGIFTTKEKGSWFFSEKYNQGGKNWIQFQGNYLFHSVPYNKSQSQILDYTLGTPSSHGCIRLSETDSKWLYDNIPSGTKVIINNE